MTIPFLSGFQSEWIKKKRSAASWLTVIGGFFIPLIVLISRMTDPAELRAANSSDQLWDMLYARCWQFMAFFLLPMGIIMATSLITQIESRNNTWKQLHTTPQRFTTIYFAKLSVIMLMMLQFFILFNVGIYLAGVVPAILFPKVPFPVKAFPITVIVKSSSMFFIDSLPIIACQYMLGLRFKNFLVPLGAGIGLYVASMIALFWKYGYIVPYAYCAISFSGSKTHTDQRVNVHLWATGYFLLFTIAGYILYITQKEKG